MLKVIYSCFVCVQHFHVCLRKSILEQDCELCNTIHSGAPIHSSCWHEIRSELLGFCCDLRNMGTIFCSIIQSSNLIAIIRFNIGRVGFLSIRSCLNRLGLKKKKKICLNLPSELRKPSFQVMWRLCHWGPYDDTQLYANHNRSDALSHCTSELLWQALEQYSRRRTGSGSILFRNSPVKAEWTTL